MEIITSFDDYSPDNIRLAKLLLEYKISAIFFVECGKPEKVEQIKHLADLGFEIGGHTMTHPQDLKILTDHELDFEIVQSRALLQENTKQEINWFCYPRGRYDDRVKEVVKNAGYKYARTVNLGIPDKYDPLAIQTLFQCHTKPEYQGENWLNYGKGQIKFMVEKFGSPKIHFWGHAFEMNKYREWDKLEELFKWINENYL